MRLFIEGRTFIFGL